MVKLDLKAELKEFYHATAKKTVLVDVPEMNFLMVDGTGDPNTSTRFQEATEALYNLSYALKFMVKKGRTGVDYKVMPLEGLWWTDNPAEFSLEGKDRWHWTLMIMQPDLVTPLLFEEAFLQVKEKKGQSILPEIRLASYNEGLAVQTMHIGPYSEEDTAIARIHSFMEVKGYLPAGKHHEIYLSNPQKTSPQRLKTIIRQPVKRV
ncbi:MAG: GyrI-like domain-containing protein [Bacillota bacterium]|nr:GyrI-like domain-containing protein [Bacillota bacterium]MDW7682806.1 GyrI-like domain-containing protein [Bacillota bacterium]